MLKRVREYINGYMSMGFYTRDKGLLYTVAFFFIFVCYMVCWSLLCIFLFVTCPIWLGPYLIFRKLKGE